MRRARRRTTGTLGFAPRSAIAQGVLPRIPRRSTPNEPPVNPSEGSASSASRRQRHPRRAAAEYLDLLARDAGANVVCLPAQAAAEGRERRKADEGRNREEQA